MNLEVKSGEKIPVTGWYEYAGHVESGDFPCFVPMQSDRMFFKKGREHAPLLGSCSHDIKWELTQPYNIGFHCVCGKWFDSRIEWIVHRLKEMFS